MCERYLPRKARDYLHQRITGALELLADRCPNFGVTRKGDSGQDRVSLERKFQLALHKQLSDACGDQHWRWTTEVYYPTRALRNGDDIRVDIVGIHDTFGAVAIELKYVTRTKCVGDKHEDPRNRYAFPYDVIKDCLKLELLFHDPINNGEIFQRPICSQLDLQDYPVNYGFVIALTNHALYWRGVELRRGTFAWALNYLEAVWPVDANQVAVQGRIETVSASGPPTQNAIFKQKRHHISLGQPWVGQWRDYSVCRDLPESARRFRYLLMRPNLSRSPHYAHDWHCPAFIPFGSEPVRNRAILVGQQVCPPSRRKLAGRSSEEHLLSEFAVPRPV